MKLIPHESLGQRILIITTVVRVVREQRQAVCTCDCQWIDICDDSIDHMTKFS